MRVPFAILTAMLLSGCQGAPAPMIIRERLTLTGPENGVVRVSGGPGAVIGAGVTTVVLAVRRDMPPKTNRYALAHFGAGLLIHSAYAVAGPDGSFPETWVGRPDVQVRADDELEIVLTAGTEPIGFALTMPLSWRP